MMKILSIPAVALVALLPLAAAAADPAPGPGGGPPPEMRAQFEKNRAAAKTAAFAALGADHRAQVQAIVDRVNAGTLTDPVDATKQIDAILTPDETKAVLAERDKLAATMHPDHMGAPPPGGPPPGMHGPANVDAGHFLLRVSVTPERARELMRAMHGTMAVPAPH